jgi:hypothetical protein
MSVSAFAITRELEYALNIHHSLKGKTVQDLPHQIVILPAHITVSKLDAPEVELADQELTDQANKLATDLTKEFLENTIGMQVLPLPELSAVNRELIQKHIDLYDIVVFEYISIKESMHPAWQHKRDNMDVTVGTGLANISQLLGVDAALIILGADQQRGIRAIAMNPIMDGSTSYLNLALVELKTGNVLWTNTIISTTANLTKKSDVSEMLYEALRIYPRYQ